jgi:ABC-type Fe3+ transport system substrate-binding protein
MTARVFLLLTLAAILAVPFALKLARVASTATDDTVVVVTPHNEAIRAEYARGFAPWYRERTGRTVTIDWRMMGGTSEIARFLEGEYAASFERLWTGKYGRRWSAAIQSGYANGRLPEDAPAEVRAAREAFLASDASCGIDVFFGGGTYDLEKQARAGRLIDSGVMQRHPEWFGDSAIPRTFGGEDYWHPQGLWIGTVLSTYGILFNRDALQRLGIARPPVTWDDLADPRLVGELALADPTKSGSVAKAFENILQREMQAAVRRAAAAAPADLASTGEARAVAAGWVAGLQLIQRIGANARYFSDTSQKIPIDVAAGNCAAGVCIDFYGRQQEEAVRRRSAANRLGYVAPEGGTVASVDPIALLRGAPHRAAATAFIEYTLSLEGQKLWNFRPGTPGGPERFVLRRLPVRRDFYAREEWKQYRTDPESPFEQRDPLIYQEAWTGGLFREMAFIIRVLTQDTHAELAAAWRAINVAPEPRRSEALAVLHALAAVDYARANGEIRRRLNSRDKVEEVRLAGELARHFAAQYREAERIARAGR